MNKQTAITIVTSVAIGFMAAWLLKPNKKQDNEVYKLEAKVLELEYNAKIKDIENQYLQRLHLLEDATPVEVDSLWNAFGF